jgi:hypothetical protein
MLRQLLEPPVMVRYGGNARRYAEQKNDLAKIIERYKAVFRRLRICK